MECSLAFKQCLRYGHICQRQRHRQPGSRSIPSRYANGQWLTSNDESNWSFGNIRSLNLFFEYVLPNIESGKLGLTDLVRQSIGEAYFFRAYQYYASYSTIGDYPIIDNVLPDDKELLLENSYRRPRNQVARHILEDLDNALAYLPESSDKGKQGVNRDCALCFARAWLSSKAHG